MQTALTEGKTNGSQSEIFRHHADTSYRAQLHFRTPGPRVCRSRLRAFDLSGNQCSLLGSVVLFPSPSQESFCQNSQGHAAIQPPAVSRVDIGEKCLIAY